MPVGARTDALAVEGIAAALDRSTACCEAGAGMIFLQGPRSMSEIEAIAARFAGRVPLVHNLVKGGITATDDGATRQRLGFAVALHLCCCMVRRGGAGVSHLRRHATTQGLPLADLAMMNEITGAAALIEWGEHHGA